MNVRRSLLGLTFCTCYLASHLTNKYVLSVLKFTYPTLFQGWQTFIGGLLLHMSWKLGWVELHSSPSALSDSARMADHQAPRILLSPQCWDYRCALPHPDSPWVLGILLRSPSLHIRSDVLIWLPASALFVGIIYAGSKALSRLVSCGLAWPSVCPVVEEVQTMCLLSAPVTPDPWGGVCLCVLFFQLCELALSNLLRFLL
ncbi:transmembrane protein 241 isoform X24 [Mus musculus]|uniref:transmembrane protein 241 isoform X24 n=1 Tax=Mus musculus TaxID=10090 RepID=UPI0005ABAC6C|nr:transmembrane protein 241 isoform X24 [Mus musculus]|eukprot:XP_011245270.1 PREDICTED: transmembrane protein 241 isoform X16 [Mus musculus]